VLDRLLTYGGGVSMQVAASGLLLLLEDVAASGSGGAERSRQAEEGEALALEVCGTLRRCLTQQASVRRILYDGVTALAASMSPNVQKVRGCFLISLL
jgi:hypothetical protein